MDTDEAEKRRNAIIKKMEARQREIRRKKEERERGQAASLIEQTFVAEGGRGGAFLLPSMDLLNISAINSAGQNENTFLGVATSTPMLARVQRASSNRSINSTDISIVGSSIDEELNHQFMALASWANTVLKSDVLGQEIELEDVKANANQSLLKILTQRKPNVENSTATQKYADWAQSKILDAYRSRCKTFFASTKIEQSMRNLISLGAVQVHADKRVFLDVELQSKILYILLSFHPFWLHMGFELIFGKKIPVKKGQNFIALISRYCRDYLFTNEKILKYKKATQGGSGNIRLMTETGIKMMHDHILHKLLMIFVFIEEAKKASIIARAPGMFGPKSEYKELKDVFAELSRLFLQSTSIMTKVLKKEGYDISFVQPFYEFYVYRITKFEDVGDGIVLGRLVEYLLGMDSNSLMSKLRSPSGDRLRKIGNLTTILTTLQERGIDIGKLTAAQIVGLDRTSIIELMWRLVGSYMRCNNVQRIPVVPLDTIEPQEMKEFRKDLVNRCHDFGSNIGIKVDGFRSIRDGTVFAEFWKIYTQNQPSLDEFDGDDLWSKVYNAAHSVLGVPQCVVMEDARSLTLFTVEFLRRLEEYKNDQQASGLQGSEVNSEPALSEPTSPATSTKLEFGTTYTLAEGHGFTSEENINREEPVTSAVVTSSESLEPSSNDENDPPFASSSASTTVDCETTLRPSHVDMEKSTSETSQIEHDTQSSDSPSTQNSDREMDLYLIDIDEMAAKRDEENAKLVKKEAEVTDIMSEQMMVTDEEMEQMEAHPEEGLVMERLDIDGEISFGWREAEPEDESGKVADEVPIVETPSVIDTPQLYINNKNTDFDQYLPNVPTIFDFAGNIEEEEPAVEEVVEKEAELVDTEVKENIATETKNTMSQLEPLPDFDLSAVKNMPSNIIGKTHVDPMIGIYERMKNLEREQSEMNRMVNILKQRTSNVTDK